MAPGGASTCTILARIAATAPVISSMVSPRTRKAMSSPPICEGVASPDIMLSNAAAACSRDSGAPVATWPRSALSSTISIRLHGLFGRRDASGRTVPSRGYVEKVAQDQVAMFGRDAFGMKLHAMHGERPVAEPHDQMIVCFRCYDNILWQVFAINDERVIARRPERSINAAKDALGAVMNCGELAVNRHRGPHNLSAKHLADRLMTETDPEDWNRGGGLLNQVKQNPCIILGARAGQENDPYP